MSKNYYVAEKKKRGSRKASLLAVPLFFCHYGLRKKRFVLLFLVLACACRVRAKREHLYQDKHTCECQIKISIIKFYKIKILTVIFFTIALYLGFHLNNLRYMMGFLNPNPVLCSNDILLFSLYSPNHSYCHHS